jgi:hypothetical protein
MSDLKLKGYSGCKLNILKTKNGSTFVKKQAKNLKYNKRLQEQARKQMNYTGVFKNCNIICEGYNDSLYEFTMEFIHGMTVAEYMNEVRIVNVYKGVDLFF